LARHRSSPPIIFPDRPERWRSDEALKAEVEIAWTQYQSKSKEEHLRDALKALDEADLKKGE